MKTDDITYTEHEGSPHFAGDDHGVRCTRKFLVPSWDEWPRFVNRLMGVHTCTYDSTKPNVKYDVPRIPLPNWPDMFVASWNVVPLRDDSPDGNGSQNDDGLRQTLSKYNTVGALVTANYDTRFCAKPINAHYKFDFTLPDGTYLAYDSEGSAEVLLTPDGTFHFDGITATDEAYEATRSGGIVIPSKIYTLTWMPVIAPPFQAIEKMKGRVNTSEFLGIGSGRLLFLGCQEQPLHRFQSGGDTTERTYYKIVYRFAAQSKQSTASADTIFGWNYGYSKKKVGSEHWLLLQDDDSNPPHLSGDFHTLFQYGL